MVRANRFTTIIVHKSWLLYFYYLKYIYFSPFASNNICLDTHQLDYSIFFGDYFVVELFYLLNKTCLFQYIKMNSNSTNPYRSYLIACI